MTNQFLKFIKSLKSIKSSRFYGLYGPSTLRTRGFTLVEIMVALMVFSLVVVVALAALTKIIDANKKAQTIQDAVINLSFAMEAMTRELRTGSTLFCKNITTYGADLEVPGNVINSQDVHTCNGTHGNSGHGVGFAFYSANHTDASGNKLIIAYEIVPTDRGGTWDGTFVFKKAVQESVGGNLSFVPVVATSSVSINDYYVSVDDSSGSYPLAFVRVDGIAGNKVSAQTTYSLQTAASVRLP